MLYVRCVRLYVASCGKVSTHIDDGLGDGEHHHDEEREDDDVGGEHEVQQHAHRGAVTESSVQGGARVYVCGYVYVFE